MKSKSLQVFVSVKRKNGETDKHLYERLIKLLNKKWQKMIDKK